jgi:hypothetical protein
VLCFVLLKKIYLLAYWISQRKYKGQVGKVGHKCLGVLHNSLVELQNTLEKLLF